MPRSSAAALPHSGTDSSVDGRRLRSVRSRGAIVNGLFELIGEGNLTPTTHQVAERANVGIRSVFRHFEDMEALYATLDERLTDELRPMLQRTPGAVR